MSPLNNSLPLADWRELVSWLARRRKRFIVENRSMQPTLNPNDLVLVDVSAYRVDLPLEDEIVVARHPHNPHLTIIKRVQFLDEAGQCYLIGDNVAEPTSQDSRSFGFVPQANLIGRATSYIRSSRLAT